MYIDTITIAATPKARAHVRRVPRADCLVADYSSANARVLRRILDASGYEHSDYADAIKHRVGVTATDEVKEMAWDLLPETLVDASHADAIERCVNAEGLLQMVLVARDWFKENGVDDYLLPDERRFIEFIERVTE